MELLKWQIIILNRINYLTIFQTLELLIINLKL